MVSLKGSVLVKDTEAGQTGLEPVTPRLMAWTPFQLHCVQMERWRWWRWAALPSDSELCGRFPARSPPG